MCPVKLAINMCIQNRKKSFVMQNITLRKNIIFMKELFSILERPILIVVLLNYRSSRKLLLFHIVLTCPQQRNQSRRLEAEVCGKKLKDTLYLAHPKITPEICLELHAMGCVETYSALVFAWKIWLLGINIFITNTKSSFIWD